ncbi:MAG: hypothetical protein NZ934_03450, partial [Hadesarchaea archaeon]|nr:hypothetical protein [Hadesarchaea archaeon]
IAKHSRGGKTLVATMLGGGGVELEERAKLQKMRIPTYPSPIRAARVLAALSRYAEMKVGRVWQNLKIWSTVNESRAR